MATMETEQVIALLQEIKDLTEAIEAAWGTRSGVGARLAQDGFQRILGEIEIMQLNIQNANNKDTN